MLQQSRRVTAGCRIGARIVNTVLAGSVIALIASHLYTTGKCYSLDFTLPCHWVFVTSSISVALAVGYCIFDYCRLSGEKPHRSNDFEGFLLKTGVLVSVTLTGIWVTSGCLLSKQLADLNSKNVALSKNKENNDDSMTLLGTIAVVCSFITAVSWLSLAFYEALDLRRWLREKRLQNYGWSRLLAPDEGYEQAEVLCQTTTLDTSRRQKAW